MSLPKIDLPLYPVTIPSTGKETTFRPFTVKEEKILLIAQESKDIDQVITAIKQIINNCVTGVNVDELSTFDCDYLLIQIRATSVSNVMEFRISDPDTEEKIDIEVDAEEITVFTPEGHSKFIKINDTNTIVMKYPSIEEFYKSLSNQDKSKQFEFMLSCVESIVMGDEIHKLKDYSEEEILEFFDGLTGSTIEQIGNFFDTMPRLRLEHKYVSDGKEKTFVIQGTETFFQSR